MFCHKNIRLFGVPTVKDVKYLTSTQHEKKLLKQYTGADVSTVHEYQSKKAKIVYVVRVNAFPQAEIYLRDAYAIVAISRHTVALRYYTMVLTNKYFLKILFEIVFI
ncbi:hypothetical protein A3Q56_08488 [Intoshia linei]|uniref:(+)RNA virus helicase C-terminal domain-containing protein n=1 Tax=Intoshia linei TaxID=1819745 RepID=A0A177APS4_9BILA|nr:hypothetical protein A3Q56_08488 [Intoshia linei]